MTGDVDHILADQAERGRSLERGGLRESVN